MADVHVLEGPNGAYIWPIGEEEEKRLTEMLGVDFKTFDVGGTIVLQPPLRCQQCHKQSGFNDFVHEALVDGIHSKEFILNILSRSGSGNGPSSPAHPLKCMNCNIYYRNFPNKESPNTGPNAIKAEKAAFKWYAPPPNVESSSIDPNASEDTIGPFWMASVEGMKLANNADSGAAEGSVAVFGWPLDIFNWVWRAKATDQQTTSSGDRKMEVSGAADA